MLNKRMTLKILGYLLMLECAMFLSCAAVSFIYKESDLISFLLSAAITFGTGCLLWLCGRNAGRQITRRDSHLIVTLSWLVFSVFGMLPYLLSGCIPSVTNAFFETVSGVTSTGSTILDNIDEMPHGILYWRSLTQWIGGLGIIMFTIAVLPIFGVNGAQIFAAEATGPTVDRVHPRIGVTAKWIWSVYLGLTILAAVLYLLGGMSVFDSVCHSMTTTSTGGFSTHQASMEYFHSRYLEYAASGMMFLSGINITLLFLMLSRKFQRPLKDAELHFYVLLTVGATAFITCWLYFGMGKGSEEAFRSALFQVTSILTSTGYSSTDYMQWSHIAYGVLFLLMFVGACAGSTTGGMKCIRMLILKQVTFNEIKRLIHPNAILPVRLNGNVLSNTLVRTALSFILLYLFIVFVGTSIFFGLGMQYSEAISVAVSCIGNIGPALDSYGPAFSWSQMPVVGKWLASFLMLLGRLEIFTIIIIFSSAFWKKS